MKKTKRSLLKKVVLAGMLLFLAKGNVFAQNNEIIISDEAELVQAIRNAQPGDEIIVMPGIYHGKLGTGSTGSGFGSAWFNSDQDGTKENPIILRSYDKTDKAVLTGTEQKVTGLRITGDYWIIEGIEVSNTQKGIILDNSSYSVIRDCEIHDTLQEGLHLRDGSSYNLVTGSMIYNTGTGSPGYGEGVYIGSDKNKWSSFAKECDYNVISSCTIGPGVAAEHFDIKEGTTGTVIEKNVMHGTGITGENYADSFIDAKGNSAIIRENTCYREKNENIVAAFQTHQQIEEWGLENKFIYNNLELDEETILITQAAAKASAYSFGNESVPENCEENTYVTILEEAEAEELKTYQVEGMERVPEESTTEEMTTEVTTELATTTEEMTTEITTELPTTTEEVTTEVTTELPTTEEVTTEITTELATTTEEVTEEITTELPTTTEEMTTEITTELVTTTEEVTEEITTELSTTEEVTTESATENSTVVNPVAVERVQVETTITLKKSKSKKLTVKVVPDNATNKKVTFTTANCKVATVDENGKVTAVAPGVTTITVSAQNNRATLVTVKVLPDKVVSLKKRVVNGKVRLTWKKQKGITGYKVYKYDKKTKKYKLYKTTKKSYVVLSKGKKNTLYKFKVKAYKKSVAGTVYGNSSKVIKLKRR